MALMGFVSSCSSDDPDFKQGQGSLSVNLNLDSSVKSLTSSRVEYSDVTVDDLTLRLVAPDGTVEKTGSPSEFTRDVKIKVGDYKLEAYYGSDEEDGFGIPYFYGSQDITITEGNLTEVDLTASLASSMVSIVYTDAFKNYFTQYSSSVLSAAGRTTAFTSDETRPAYISAGEAKIFVDVTKPNGLSATLQPAEFVAEAKHHYTVTLDINQGAGAPVLRLSFDDSVGKEDVEIELSDELMNAPAPEISCTGFTPGEPIHIVEGTPFDGDLKMSIMARGLIGQVPMVTVSSQLTGRGWPEDIDLVAASAGQQALLSQLGLNVLGLWRNPERMAVLDFSKIASELTYTEGASNVNRITVYVKDKFTKVCEPVTLEIVIDKLELSLSDVFWKEGETHLSAILTYSGPSVKDNVVVQYKNNRGTWTTADYTATLSRAAGDTYNINVTLGDDVAASTELRAIYKDKLTSNAVPVKPTARELALNCAPADMWATHAKVNFISSTADYTSEQLAATATVLIAADGGDWTEATVERTTSSPAVNIKGLIPGKTYQVKAYIGNNPDRDSQPITVTTETAAQLPNSGFEDWSISGSGKNWELPVPGGDVWGTNNPMTTSQGSDNAYCRISGTISTSVAKEKESNNDATARSGSNAALLRTVGWGSGNTATGSGGNSGKTKYIDAGLLHLGSSRSARPDGYGDRPGTLSTADLNCGLAFGSRPSALTFWYRYIPKNSSDKGVAEVTVYDASGNAIATNRVELGAASAYTQATLPLTYPGSCPKGARIYVKFLSTNSESFLVKNDSNLSGPGFANLSRGKFQGSQLYIDDLVLSY